MKSNTSQNNTKKSFTIRGGNKRNTENMLAIEETKKLYQKYYSSPNPLFLNQLKTDKFNIYLNNFNFNDISVINKILSKYYFIQHITLAPYDPAKKNPDAKSKKNNRLPITEGERVKLEKQKHDEEIERKAIINKITAGVGKYLRLSDKVLTFSLINFDLEKELAEQLSKGIIKNKSLQGLSVNGCKMTIESYEILLKGLLDHQKLEYLDLSNNNLGDKFGNMISRIIARQTQRRDQVIWLYGLRNERPLTNDYTRGLISINLNNNQLSSSSADCITTSLAYDQYIRFINLRQNCFDNESCKKFIHMMRKNLTLLNLDLRENPGYDENINSRIVMKMSKNIRYLYQLYQNNAYTEEEFENFKVFIDISFFDMDIPQEVVEYYNNNLETTANTQNNLTNENALLQMQQLQQQNLLLQQQGGGEINNLNVMNDIQEVEEEDEKDKEKESISISSKNKSEKVSQPINFKKKEDNKENEKLMQENILLKQKIIELKAKNIQEKLGNELMVPSNFDSKNLDKNYSRAIELMDNLNELMNKMAKDKEKSKNKNDNNSNNNSNTKKTENSNIKKNTKEIKKDSKNEEQKEIAKNNKKENKENKNNNTNNPNKKIKEDENISDIPSLPLEKNNNKSKEEEYNKAKNVKKTSDIDNNINKNLIEDDDEEEDVNLDNLTDEEKVALIQQQQMFYQLQQEAAARGQKFELEDFIALLENQNEEEEDEQHGLNKSL